MIPAYKALEILIDKMLAVSNPVISCYIITGYPRNMRDVVEYMAKVGNDSHYTIINLLIKLIGLKFA